jgi:hypothetical protein
MAWSDNKQGLEHSTSTVIPGEQRETRDPVRERPRAP